MGATAEQRRYYALQHRDTNEKACNKYFDEIRRGTDPEEARELVKQAFDIGDRRLDNILSSRAGQFAPGTVAELEAIATQSLARIDLATRNLVRFYQHQLDELDDLRDGKETHYEIKLVVEKGGKGGYTEKSERLPLNEAEQRLLKAIIEAEQLPLEAMRKMKVDTVINIRHGADIATMSADELDKLLELHSKGETH